MVKVAIAEFRAHMAKYLAYVMEGQVVVLTSHGKTVVELRQPADRRAEAQQRLTEVAAEAEVGDVLGPAVDDFDVA